MLVLTLYIARSLGVESLGEYSLVLSFMAIFASISYFGQHFLVPREVARNRSQAYTFLINSSLIGLAASLPTAILMVFIANLMNYSAQVVGYITIASLVLIPDTLVIIAETVILGLEKLEYVTVTKFFNATFRVGFSLILLYLGYGLGAIFVILGISLVITYVAYMWIISGIVNKRQTSHLNLVIIKGLAQSSLIFLVVSINASLFKRIDVILLSKLAGVDSVGIYTAAGRLVLMIETTAPAFLLSVFPVLSAAYMVSPDKFEEISKDSLKLVIVAIVPLVIVLASIAEWILPFLFGPEFINSVMVFRILVWMLIPGLASSMLFRTILASNNEKISLLFGATKAIVSISLNLLLIPKYGALGAALAAVATQSVALCQVYWFTSKKLFKIGFINTFIKPSVCAFVAGGLFFYFWQANLYVFMPFALLVYSVMLIMLGVISDKELFLLRKLWRRAQGTLTSNQET